jgi:hypothetical protein
MKQRLILFTLLLIAFSCKDQTGEVALPSNNPDALIREAKQNFEAKALYAPTTPTTRKGFSRKSLTKTAAWAKASIKQFSMGQAVVVPITFDGSLYAQNRGDSVKYDLNNLTYLLSYKDKRKEMHHELLTIVPDGKSSTGNFSGTITVEDWAGTFLRGYLYKDGLATPIAKSIVAQVNGKVPQTTCTITDWYTCTKDKYGRVISCSYDYSEITCTTDYSAGGTEGAGSGGSPTPSDYGNVGSPKGKGSTGGGGTSGGFVGTDDSTPAYIVPGLRGNLIKDPKDYLKCFDQTKGAIVTIYVAQPIPGSRDVVTPDLSSPTLTDVGHTFIGISQNLGSSTITRYFGFYPKNNASTKGPSGLGNDQYHKYNIQLPIQVNANQLSDIINMVVNGTPAEYDLSGYNCTNFAITIASLAGVKLPSTISYWGTGQGCNPGDIGEDLRKIPGSNSNTTTRLTGNVGSCGGDPIPDES